MLSSNSKMAMKKLYKLFFVIAACAGLSACVDNFLEKPDTSGTVDLDEVYSSAKNAEGALASCYRRALVQGWPTGIGLYHGALASISGERYMGWNWHGTYDIAMSGLKASGQTNAPEGTAGADNFPENWSSIRACYLVKENIDRVPDMGAELKTWIKGEATALVAYRYMGMFYRYGGLPIVRKSFLPDDDLMTPRSSLQDTLEFILGLCDEAYSLLPDNWAAKYDGRMTKGAALAMKARVLQFAARPLFNSSTPYLDDAQTNSLVCFGNVNPDRWQDAVNANEAVLTWAVANGYQLINTGNAGEGQPNSNALDDYGTAVSLPGNKEILLAYKFDEADQANNGRSNTIARFYNTSAYYDGNNRFETDQVGLLTNFLENYYAVDGTELNWPKVGASVPADAQRWYDNIGKIEPRFKADYIVPYVESSCNPGDNKWSLAGWGRHVANVSAGECAFPNKGEQSGRGAGTVTKFYYKAGSRIWFEPPLFRLAEIYLNLAEAYNELSRSTEALKNLNKVHNRAGLPAIKETDQGKLREIIWREKAIEFAGENQRYFDVKHWKHPKIDKGIIGGQMRELQFYSDDANQLYLPGHLISWWDWNSYVAYWHPRMYLEPLPQVEVNKGILVQNPGY